MAQLLVASTFDKWYRWSSASARGYRSDNDLTLAGSTGLTQVDMVPGADEWFQFQGSVLQSGLIPTGSVITRYRVFWRQQGTADPCAWDTNIWTEWTSAWRFSIGPDSITDPNDGLPGYNITYGFNSGNYLASSTYPSDLCPQAYNNCCIDSDTFDPSITRFTDADPNKSLDNPSFWNNLSNLYAGFTLPTDVMGSSPSNFIGPLPTTDHCCVPQPVDEIAFWFVVDYESAATPYYRRRYYVSFAKYQTDVTGISTASQTTTTATTTTTTTVTVAPSSGTAPNTGV